MKFKLSKLPNQLEVISIPLSSLESVAVSVWVRAGSRVEEDEKQGLAHFLEHMAFKGGKRYKNAKAISEAIDSIGGEFNAATSKEFVKYFIKARFTHIDKILDVLSDIIVNPSFPEKDLEKERNVILQELKMYEDTPVKRIWDFFERLIFAGSNLGRDIIGEFKTIKSIKREDLFEYWRRNYFSENIKIAIAGRILEANLDGRVFDFFKNLAKGKAVKKENEKDAPDLGSGAKIKIYQKEVEQTHFILGFPAERLGGEDRYKDMVLESVLGGGASSRLFTEVREKKGLAYAVRSGFERYTDCGYHAVYAGTDPRKTLEAIKVICNVLFKLASGKLKISKKELVKAKEFIKGHFSLSLEDTLGVADFFGYEKLMLDKVRTPKEFFDNIDKVKVEDVYHSARKIFKSESINLCVLGPVKNEEKFESLINSITS